LEIPTLENQNQPYSYPEDMLIDIDDSPLVSVIVPIFNEEESLPILVSRLNQVAKGKWEILFIDDGSTDSTIQVLNELDNEKIHLIKHPENLGKGAAIRTGLEHARGEVVIIQDADLEYDPADIQRIITPILKGNYDVVFGSRFLNGQIEEMSASHLLGNRILSKTTSILFGKTVTDVMTGHKAFRRDIFYSEQIKCRGFEFEVELTHLLLKSNGTHFLEIPIYYKKRVNGKAKIAKSDGLRGFLMILKCVLNLNP